MVVYKVTSSSFCLRIFLVLLALKTCSFLETKDHKDSCTTDFYRRQLSFCPKGRKRMAMGNNFQTYKERPSLKDLNHEFREVGGLHVLFDLETEGLFEFDVYQGNRALNQKRYEELGEAITEYVYEYLEKTLKLERVTIPVNAGDKEPKGFFFMSEDAQTCDKLMILIHGSGVVRAGQWARSLIINESFESGTMVPYIERAKEEGFGVLITNGNHNYDENSKYERIKGSENPQDHFVYIWNNFIKDAKAKAKHIVIVAHSFGGVVVQHCVRNIKETEMNRIKAVAFTDSVHSAGYGEKRAIQTFFRERTRNWVSSSEELDTPIRYYGYSDGASCDLVSAGTYEHVWTSHCAKESVFNFFKEKLDEEEKKTRKDDVKERNENTNKEETTGSDKNEDKKSKGLLGKKAKDKKRKLGCGCVEANCEEHDQEELDSETRTKEEEEGSKKENSKDKEIGKDKVVKKEQTEEEEKGMGEYTERNSNTGNEEGDENKGKTAEKLENIDGDKGTFMNDLNIETPGEEKKQEEKGKSGDVSNTGNEEKQQEMGRTSQEENEDNITNTPLNEEGGGEGRDVEMEELGTQSSGNHEITATDNHKDKNTPLNEEGGGEGDVEMKEEETQSSGNHEITATDNVKGKNTPLNEEGGGGGDVEMEEEEKHNSGNHEIIATDNDKDKNTPLNKQQGEGENVVYDPNYRKTTEV